MAVSPSATVIEDYLKVIYAHTEWQPEPITSSQLATRLALAPSTVTEMVKKLVAKGLVEHRPYAAITLTEIGRAQALRIVRRHRLIETWLVGQFGYSWDEVHDEAEVLEHAISDRLLDAIDAALGHPRHDPHGDPIPDGRGAVVIPDAVRADALREGDRGVIVRISDRDPAVLRHVAQCGLEVGGEVGAEDFDEQSASDVWVSLI
ncbi:metal-dependent transcriptional regulator [Amnibacterium flavum]|uniref:Manganese transport regulator n=1 Tax=Amnibacterium flavum TaxID=2173173 RepID=A0A2V1HMI6_9MICO|nr:metal-dependent transcriptional regulator [Amnibacterium flavum]PVZ93833.1 transcriptional regulator [Amnibacterium flavum]